MLDTAGDHANAERVDAGSTITVTARSLLVLRAYEETPEADHSVAASLAAQTATDDEASTPKSGE